MPHCDDAPLAPCLHTGTPAAAVTMAAIVDTLIECERSPPVPTMSTARDRSSSPSGTSVAAASTASSSPDSSSAVSPLIRSATEKAISCAGVAPPDRIAPIAVAAWWADRVAALDQVGDDRRPTAVGRQLVDARRRVDLWRLGVGHAT